MPVDQYHGQGGSYVVNDNGERELVERTLTEIEVKAAEQAKAEEIKTSKKPGKEK